MSSSTDTVAVLQASILMVQAIKANMLVARLTAARAVFAADGDLAALETACGEIYAEAYAVGGLTCQRNVRAMLAMVTS